MVVIRLVVSASRHYLNHRFRSGSCLDGSSFLSISALEIVVYRTGRIAVNETSAIHTFICGLSGTDTQLYSWRKSKIAGDRDAVLVEN